MSFLSQTTQTGAPAPTSGLLRGGPLVAGVEVAVLISEAHNLTANATKLSLESGAQVTDHVIVNPDDVSVVFSMTNAGDGAETARDVFETFKRMRDDRELVELTTEHHIYENMVITGISPMHQAPYKGALNVTLHLEQINFVQLESVGRVNLAGKTAKTGAPPTNSGKQDAPPVRTSAIVDVIDGRKSVSSVAGGG